MNLEASLHSLLSFVWTLIRPTNYLRQNIVFSYSEMSFFFLIISLFLFLFLFFVFLLFYVILLLIIFTKTMLLLSFYLINYFSWKLLLFFRVPACSGVFHVPGFIDALKIILFPSPSSRWSNSVVLKSLHWSLELNKYK